MSHLAAAEQDPGQLDLLELVADNQTPLESLESLSWDAFRQACYIDACGHDGWVHPSRVSRILHDRIGEFEPRSFSAKWAPACGHGDRGFMDKTDHTAPIDPSTSKNNGGKLVRLRRWRGWDPPPARPS